MLAISSPEKRHHSTDLQTVKKTRKVCVVFNQSSTEDEFHQIEPLFPISTFEDLLANLSTVDLSKKEIATLPECPFFVNNLRHLKIDKIGISSLPSKIGNFRSLTHLDASENEIEDLPNGLGNLENLEILNLRFNRLSKLPLSCFALSHLKQLLLSNNRFKLVPECVQEAMKNLEILELSNNPLRFISPPASTKLRRFTAKGLKYCRLFPEWLLNSKFWKLDEIILDESTFTNFCFRENSNSHLRSLSMTNCSLNDTSLQKITSNMVELENINVDNTLLGPICEKKTNKFCFMPGCNLKNPGRVKEISARLAALPILPHSIGDFSNLKRLDIGGNNLCWLPNEICKLRNLEVLIIDRCGLCDLPKEFGGLNKLEEFVACNNRLSKLPKSMADLQNLAILDLFDNEFSIIPICLGGKQLRCLDLELNFFKIDNPLMRNTPYVVLRERLRRHYNCESRYVGSKAYKDDESYEFNDSKPTDTCSESEYGEITSEINECCTEDWNLSEDSADEYEPTREAKLKLPSAKSLKQFHLRYNSYFRPSDIHSQRVRDVVRRMKKKNPRINSTCKIEEGQFDDA